MIKQARAQAAFFRYLTVKQEQQHRYRTNQGLYLKKRTRAVIKTMYQQRGA